MITCIDCVTACIDGVWENVMCVQTHIYEELFSWVCLCILYTYYLIITRALIFSWSECWSFNKRMRVFVCKCVLSNLSVGFINGRYSIQVWLSLWQSMTSSKSTIRAYTDLDTSITPCICNWTEINCIIFGCTSLPILESYRLYTERIISIGY